MITYAKVYGPPDNWHKLEVIDKVTKQKVSDVVEVNTVEGWVVRFAKNAAGRPMYDPANPRELLRERVTGNFEIVERK